jgi:hypothetical protein
MISRCTNPKFPGYKNYGGRGITVCERWRQYEHFLADMGERPHGMTIERKDNDGNYEPDNCRWATRLEQANNKRTNVFIEFDGKRMTRSQWERELGLGSTTLRNRLRNGKSIEEAMRSDLV